MTTLDFEDILNISFIIDKKNIRYLTHYTNIANIENILKYGLMPISLLHNNNIKFYKNDPDRADYTDAICLNIEFPNYKLFYKNRINSNTDWAVIILNAENILCSLDVAFCRTNAANYYMSSYSASLTTNRAAYNESGSTNGWWLRSPNLNYISIARRVDYLGYVNGYYAYDATRGLAFGFCIR